MARRRGPSGPASGSSRNGPMQYGDRVTGGDPLVQADLAVRGRGRGLGRRVHVRRDRDRRRRHVRPVGRCSRRWRCGPSGSGSGRWCSRRARRRPWKLAREAMTVDRLSGGRLVLPVGLGALDDQGFGNVGEETDARVRAELLDETLAILDGLWSGEPFAFDGDHYRFGPMTFRPTPVQRPRIPIWVVGAWPHARSMRRAARWDGVVVQADGVRMAARPATGLLAEAVGWLVGTRAREGRIRPVRHRRRRQQRRRPAARGTPSARRRDVVDRGGLVRGRGAQRRRIEAGPPAPDARIRRRDWRWPRVRPSRRGSSGAARSARRSVRVWRAVAGHDPRPRRTASGRPAGATLTRDARGGIVRGVIDSRRSATARR